MQNLYDIVRNFKKEDGSLLCDAFIRVPKRRQEPGYHDVSEFYVKYHSGVSRKTTISAVFG